MKKNVFLICPIRDIPFEYEQLIKMQVEYLEHEYEVYYPGRDTNQHKSEINICNDNLEAMKKADVVFVVWDGKSQGCLFDLGMAFALGKKVQSIIGYMPSMSSGKSFQNLVYEIEERQE